MAWNWQADTHAHGKERQFQYKSRQSAPACEKGLECALTRKPRPLAARHSVDDAILVCENVSRIEAIADAFWLLFVCILTVFTRK
jgi:hypothetical protein